jgi:hypothetical protein
MGVVADDLDGDGRIDLFITNLVNESSTLFRNLGHGLFYDATLAAGIEAPSRPTTGFGDAAFDANNDGLLDLLVANGHVDDRPWANSPMANRPLFYWGRSDGRFRVVQPAPNSYLEQPVVGRGLAVGDLDNDGRVDALVVHRDRPAVLLRNETPGGHWLNIRLRGRESGSTPVGAQVRVRTGTVTRTRWLSSGTGYLSAHDDRLSFGLGEATIIDSLEVRWPSGRSQSWSQVRADQFLAIEEGHETFGKLSSASKKNSPTTPRRAAGP